MTTKEIIELLEGNADLAAFDAETAFTRWKSTGNMADYRSYLLLKGRETGYMVAAELLKGSE